jgi:gas vesicle protein
MKYLLSAIGGAAIGAGAALLFAPRSGRATRAAIRDKSTRYSHEIRDFAKGKSKYIKNRVQGMKHQFAGMQRKKQEGMEHGQEGISLHETAPVETIESPYATSTI